MNAALPAEAVAVATLRVADIVPSPSNPRKHFDEAYLAELAESIKSHGLIQPITVRPIPFDHLLEFNRRPRVDPSAVPTYEIVVGECRWRAAKLAGMSEIPGFWRELDDKQVLEIQVIENLQRRDVHPIEEAEGYEALMTRHSYKADDIAVKIGKSRGYVYARLKLTALCHDARDAFFDGKIDASTALLIARIPGASLQKRAVRDVTNGYNGEPLSYRNAKNHIQHHFTISLKHATFPLADVALVADAGSCVDCPKRSGNMPEICTDLDDDDVCTDTSCFENKRLTRRQNLIDHAEKIGVEVCTGDAGWTALRDPHRIDVDKVVEGDPEDRTYRDILGDKLPAIATLAEVGHGQRQRLIEMADATAIKKALVKAGWQPDLLKNSDEQAWQEKAAEREREQEARREAIKIEGAWRDQLTDTLLKRIEERGDENRLNIAQTIAVLACAWLREQLAYVEMPEELLETHGIQLPAEYDADEQAVEICATIRSWRLGQALAFLFDALSHTDQHDRERAPATLLDLAELVDFDPQSLREPVATASTPSEAAQAQEDSAAPATPAKPKAAKKTKAKASPAPAQPANEPAAPVKPHVEPWPFPTGAEA